MKKKLKFENLYHIEALKYLKLSRRWQQKFGYCYPPFLKKNVAQISIEAVWDKFVESSYTPI